MKVRSTQSREGVKGGLRPFSSAPCRVKGQRPLWGLGQRPNCYSGAQFQGSHLQRRRQRSVPASNFALPQKRPPSCSFQRLCCVAQMAQPNCLSFRHGCLFPQAGISRLRARVGGFAVAPDAPSHCTSMFLDFSRCRGNRACGRDKEAFRSPLDPFGSHCRSWFLSLQGELHPQHRSENHYRDSKRLSPLTSPSPSPSA